MLDKGMMKYELLSQICLDVNAKSKADKTVKSDEIIRDMLQKKVRRCKL
jgi:hypothetical protein